MICTTCKQDKLPGEFYWNNRGAVTWRQRCRACVKIARKSINQRPTKLKQLYGITQLDYDRILKEQGGVCACCRGLIKFEGVLHVDHNHVTGKIRGLLCKNCNTTIGNINENKEVLYRIIEYLELHKISVGE